MPSYFVRDVASASSFYPSVLHQSKFTNGLIEQQQQQHHDCIGNSGDVRSASQLQLRKQQNTLNVNGKKFYRNKDKTIWSYNPDDFLIRVSFKSFKVSVKSINCPWRFVVNGQLSMNVIRSFTVFTKYYSRC